MALMTGRPVVSVGAAMLLASLWASAALAQAVRAAPISGRLVDPDGAPVPDARVAILSEKNNDLRCERGVESDQCFDTLVARGAVRAEGRSGPDGRFTLAVPGGLTNFDHIRADGQDARGRRLSNSWPIHPNRSIASSDLGLIKLGRSRELVVLVQGGGRPIADAEVDFNRGEKHRTDQTGAAVYRFYAPAESESESWQVVFTVRAPGFAVDAWFEGLPSGSMTHVVNLVPEIPLSGRVLDPNGLPVADATVALRPIEPWLGPVAVNGGGGPPDDTIARSRADSTGRFVLHGLSPARTYRVAVDAPGQPSVAGLERVVPGGTAAMDFVLGGAGRVDLDVEGPAGTEFFLQRLSDVRNLALGNRQLWIEWFDPATGAWQPVTSPRQVVNASRGHVRLRIDQVPSGTIRIVTEGDGAVAGDVSETIPVVAGIISAVPIWLAPVRQLRLQVNDAHGRPVRGARVEAFAHTGRSSTYVNTGPDGVATLQVHPAHDVKVTVTVSGQLVATAVVPAGAENPPPVVVPAR